MVNTINAIQKSPLWESTAIIVNWDDSDGWYHRPMGPVVNSSSVLNPIHQSQFGDNRNDTGKCGNDNR